MSETKTIIRYRKAFQQKVVYELKSGKLAIAKARKIYDIKSGNAIQYWLKKYVSCSEIG